ncbi:radical SAM family heme chaperone HemW [Tessaracoccus oleiagri]|uniref:Heme chaperone HemW n=1 Tax=Tessaracoccus oleiagri TaxID=686624 RepID=A0A1G9LRC5_9ACTN|nr:radical SAM family heme chaperone HemW [Tessaracoccus oleiagri]SDL64602.1 oxygen-independent coproporphyrinogen-3 oxidase [Tessaracoccus oleiagri]
MPSQLPDGEPVPADGALPAGVRLDGPLSLYVHVPFCRTRCGYCDFNTYTPSELGGMSTDAYLEAALRELDLARRVVGGADVSTIFFGGGTPTMLPARQLAGFLEAIADRFHLVDGAEVTTEANPDSVDADYFRTLRSAGFTRISLGFQSAVPHVLDVLERTHTPDRGLHAARWAADAGFEHVSLDLIYGTPGESLADWQRSLDAVTSTPVDHVSAYSLIVEPGTRLAMQVRRGLVGMPDEDDLADKYLVADEFLAAQGFANYEVSNWARPGGECRHNLAYWRGGDWWGIGPGAHSHVDGVRFWNRKHPAAYAERILAGESPAQGRERLTPEDRRVERVLLELRLAEGLPLDVLTESERARVPDVAAAGWGLVRDGRLTLTQAGRLMADGIVRDLLD